MGANSPEQYIQQENKLYKREIIADSISTTCTLLFWATVINKVVYDTNTIPAYNNFIDGLSNKNLVDTSFKNAAEYGWYLAGCLLIAGVATSLIRGKISINREKNESEFISRYPQTHFTKRSRRRFRHRQ